jgi:hypothetical protein
MKKSLFIFMVLLCHTAGFAKNPPWMASNEKIPAYTNLDIRWQDAPKFPHKVWVYDLLPNTFSPEIISNAMTLCSFTQKDKVEDDRSGVVFQNKNGSRSLSISFSSGEIQYETPERRYSATNLAVDVPQLGQLPSIATNLLRKLGIKFSDITGYSDTNRIEYLAPAMTLFYIGDDAITNIPYRTILFKRIVDGMPIAHRNFRLNVGEHGTVSKISVMWPTLKRAKSYRTVSPRDVVNLLRAGNAVRGPVPTTVGGIDWPNIKSLKIKKAVPSYQMDGDRLYPFLYLDAVVDMGSQTVEIGMGCPLIDETKL